MPYPEDLTEFAQAQRNSAWGRVISIVEKTIRDWWYHFTSYLPTAHQIREQSQKTLDEAAACLPSSPPLVPADPQRRPAKACPARGQTPASCPAPCPDQGRQFFRQDQRQAGNAAEAETARNRPASSSTGARWGGSSDSSKVGDQVPGKKRFCPSPTSPASDDSATEFYAPPESDPRSASASRISEPPLATTPPSPPRQPAAARFAKVAAGTAQLIKVAETDPPSLGSGIVTPEQWQETNPMDSAEMKKLMTRLEQVARKGA